MRIACIGEAMIELSLDGDQNRATLGFAGDTLNTAIYLRRAIAPEHDVAFVSLVGMDELSDRLVDFIRKQKVLVQHIGRHAELLPGIYSISLNEAGERSFSYWRENSAVRNLFQKPDGRLCFEILESFNVIYASAITLAILPGRVRTAFFEWIKIFRVNGGIFAFDSNYRPRLWNSLEEARNAVEHAWRLCDIALPSEDDERALFNDANTDEIRSRFDGYGVRAGALKRGVAGPLPINAQIDLSLEYPPATNVVDTTAAGDSFSGAFLAEYLTSGNLTDALQSGHACASIVVGHRGAITKLP